MTVRLAAALLVVFFALNGPGVSAESGPGECDLNPYAVGCDAGGGGDGGGTSSTTTTTVATTWHWGPWTRSGMDCADGDPRYVRLMHWEDHSYVLPGEFVGTPPDGSILGTSVVYQQVCVGITVETRRAWSELVRAVESLPDPVPAASPSSAAVTGLESWFWLDAVAAVGPVAVSWTDPSVGTTFDLEGRAWIGSVRWEVEPGVERWVTSVGFADAADVLGSADAPAVRHAYEVASADAGFPDGHPVAVTLTWEGEWRWRERGGAWEPWRPMATTVAATTRWAYPVLEVVGVLDQP